MPMITCAECGYANEVPSGVSGVQCAKCGRFVTIPDATAAAAPGPQTANAPLAAAPTETQPFLPRGVDFALDKLRTLLTPKFFAALWKIGLLAGEFICYLAAILFAV